MEWLIYLLKVSACLALFYALYSLFLQRLTFFSLNRIYLLSALVISFAVPALNVQIEETRAAVPTDLYNETARVNVEQNYSESLITKATIQQVEKEVESFDWEQVLFGVYILGGLCVLVIFILQMLLLLKHTRKANTRFGRLKIVYKPEGFTNCSFLNYVFVSRRDLDDHEINILLQHENAHASRYHSIDKLLMTFCKVVLWFNPLMYLYDRSLEQIHEYEADKETALKIGNTSYAQLLLNMAVKKNNLSLVHNFVKNPLKERIKMLFTNQSKNMKKLMYLTCLPLLAILFWGFSISYVYNEPVRKPFRINAPEAEDSFKVDSPQYRQKVKRSPQLLKSQKEYAEWRKTDEYKKRVAEAHRIGFKVIVGTIKDNPNIAVQKKSPLLFVTDKQTYVFDRFGLNDKILSQIKNKGLIEIKVGLAGINKNEPYLSVSASKITKNNAVIYVRPELVASAFLYEVNKVRFTDGVITGVTNYTANDKELEVTGNGYKFFVKIGSQQVDVKELKDFKKGDHVRLRFVHEVKSGAKSYTITDWVAISKDIRSYGVKNKEMFEFFYEKITNDKLTYSTSGSSVLYNDKRIVYLNGNATLQNEYFFIKADTIKLQDDASVAYAKNVSFNLPKDGSNIKSPYVKFNLKNGTYELLKTYDKF